MGKLLRENLFVAGLAGMLLLAFAVPELGARDGPLRAGILTKAGVMVIFFLQGLSLKTRELVRGFRNLRVHGFVQAWIFILAAGVLAGTALLLDLLGEPAIAEGFFYLALVPTTISSAVAFTSASGGNVAVAIFNTTLSNIIGVFWVPVGCVLLFSSGGGTDAGLIGSLLIKLAWLILLPLAAGQLLRPVVRNRGWFKAAAPRFKRINHGIILFIVFSAFSQSVLNDTWTRLSTGSVLLLILACLGAAMVIHAGVWTSGGLAIRDKGDRIAALFCGSQKTLAAGAPMAVAIFGDGSGLVSTDLGLLLLPLLCYHPMQLFLAAILMPRLAR